MAERDPERCLRCAVPIEWRHQTWQCPRCRFKLDCCEAESTECEAPAIGESSRRRFACALSRIQTLWVVTTSS